MPDILHFVDHYSAAIEAIGVLIALLVVTAAIARTGPNKQIKAQETQVQLLEAQNSGLRDESSGLRNEISDLKDRITELRQQLEERSLASWVKDRAEALAAVQSYGEQRDALAKEVEAKNFELAMLRAAGSIKASKLKLLEETVAAYKNDMKNLERMRAQAQDVVSSLTRRIAERVKREQEQKEAEAESLRFRFFKPGSHVDEGLELARSSRPEDAAEDEHEWVKEHSDASGDAQTYASVRGETLRCAFQNAGWAEMTKAYREPSAVGAVNHYVGFMQGRNFVSWSDRSYGDYEIITVGGSDGATIATFVIVATFAGDWFCPVAKLFVGQEHSSPEVQQWLKTHRL